MLSTPKAKGGFFLASSLCDGLEDNDIKQVTTLLLNNEADPNVLIPSHGVTPFHLVIGNDSEAFAEEVTKLFLRHGGNPNIRASDGLTPVHVAAAWGRVSVLELLLANGGDPLSVDDDGRNPFHYAFDGKYYKAITVLGKYCEESRDDDKDVKFTMAFDKLVLKNSDVMAEYIAPEKSELDEQASLNESDSKIKQEATASSPNYEISAITLDTKPVKLYSSPWLPVRKGSGAVSRQKQAKQELEEAMVKEKHLVNKIIDQLSTSLKSKEQKDRDALETRVKCEPNETSTSDLNSSYQLSTDENHSPHTYLKKKVKSEFNATPRRARNNFSQSNRKPVPPPRFTGMSIKPCDRIPLTPLFYNDAILSKSPNLKINCEPYTNDQSRYGSPMRTRKQQLYEQKAFTPGIVKYSDSNRLEELQRLGKDGARTTPRRKKIYHHRTPLRKVKNSYSPDSSPDSAASFSPDDKSDRRLNGRRIRDRLVVKLDGNKYDDDEVCDSINQRLKSLDIGNLRGKDNSIDDHRRKYDSTLNSSDPQVKHSSGFSSLDSFESINNLPSEDEHRTLSVPSRDKNYNIRSVLKPEGSTLASSMNWDSSSLSSFRSARSFVSVQENFKYEDAEEGVAFLERRLYIVPSCKSSEDEGCDPDSSSTKSRCSTMPDLPAEFQALSNQALRERLVDLGLNPGPITLSTRNVYIKRLVKLENDGSKSSPRIPTVINGSVVNIEANLRYGDWVDQLHACRILEKNTFKEFMNPDPSRRWREGVNKTSFNYLLLDPRITNDLPYRAVEMSNDEVWHTFLSSIFYVGKGKKTRPYAHLYDAFNAFCNTGRNAGREKPWSKKIQRILDIWNEGHGVVCLHVFHNVIPVEAYTREASMIDARGLNQLCNQKTGDYYGLAATWNAKEKFRFGRYLLFRALQILLHDGERQLLPDHL